MRKLIKVADVLKIITTTFSGYDCVGANGIVIASDTNGILFLEHCGACEVETFKVQDGIITFFVKEDGNDKSF